MGSQVSIHKVTFEDMQNIVKDKRHVLLISTLSSDDQSCLLHNTVNWQQEERILNGFLKQKSRPDIVIYGRNCNDNTVYQKYMQLTALGFSSIRIYPGGMFEWLCLQDIYGEDEFPTTKKELDILRYKPPPMYSAFMIENGRP